MPPEHVFGFRVFGVFRGSDWDFGLRISTTNSHRVWFDCFHCPIFLTLFVQRNFGHHPGAAMLIVCEQIPG